MRPANSRTSEAYDGLARLTRVLTAVCGMSFDRAAWPIYQVAAPMSSGSRVSSAQCIARSHTNGTRSIRPACFNTARANW
jgi:hypothetical protein